MTSINDDKPTSELADLADERVSLLPGPRTDDDEPASSSTSLRWKGVLCALFCCSNDIAQSEYTQWQYGDLEFSSYLFLTWFTTVWLALALPVGLLVHWLWLTSRRDPRAERSAYRAFLRAKIFDEPRLGLRTYLLGGAVVMVLNFVSTYLWYPSLGMLPVALNFALSHSIVIIVLVLSRIFLKDPITLPKVLTVVGVAGAMALIIVGKANHSDFSSHAIVTGIILVFASILLWAFYDIAYKRMFGEVNVFVLLAAQSAIGVAALVGGAVAIPLAWRFGLEPPVEFSGATVAFLFTSAAFSVTYFVAYAAALVATSPVWVAFIDLTDVPLSAVTDYLLWGTTYPAISIVGMAFLVVVLTAFNAYELCFKSCRKSPKPKLLL
eukprot:TRINITY_DN12671_c0_g1_i1.p1 TRINITY_DN12671_c0_g1~~TRINITY_DN12671_c0_g1_i1.p1  ORF type:complete len:381 (-),score=128.86 TRINITY_DN12671_c0_g1_i1:301-1443(-)